MKTAPPLLALALLLPAPAFAWDDAAQVVHGSARVLDKGETMIGILTPLSYGLHERVTMFTHPALYLLLTPNVWARLALLEARSGLSLEGGYQQSFLSVQEREDRTYPGFFQMGAVYSFLITPDLQVNAAGGYVLDIDPDPGTSYRTGLYWRAGADLLFDRVNLFLGEVRGRVMGGDAEWPTSTLIYARQLGRMRIGAGACFGRFQLLYGNAESDHVEIPVYPWFDVWWRF